MKSASVVCVAVVALVAVSSLAPSSVVATLEAASSRRDVASTVSGDPEEVKATPVNSTATHPTEEDRNGIKRGHHIHTQETREEDVPLSLRAYDVSTHSMTLSWAPPVRLNPVNFKISFDATKEFVDSQGITQTQIVPRRSLLLDPETRSHTINELSPFTTYNVNVSAIPADHQYRPPTKINVTTQMAAPQPMVKPDFYGVVNGAEIQVILPQASEEYGPISHYYLIVVPRNKQTLHKNPDQFLTEEMIASKGQKQERAKAPYIAAKFSQRNIPYTFFLGNGETVEGFVNHRLQPAKKYRIFVRAVVDTPQKDLHISSPFSEFLSLDMGQVPPAKGQSLPEPPSNVRVSVITATSFHLTWSYGGAEELQYYVIQYKPKHTNQEYSEISDITTTNYTFSGLSPYTEYELFVIAVNNIGRGPPSTPAIVTTGETEPGTAPRNVQVRTVSTITVVIQWDEPETPNGQVTGYNVYYTTTPNLAMESWESQMVANNRLTTISSLTPFTIYTIRVQAFTSVGPGPLSNPVLVKTQQGVPSQPNNLRTSEVGETSVTLQWSRPSHSGANIVVYELYWNDTQAKEKNHRRIPNSESYVLTGLNPDTQYFVWLAARSQRGEGVTTLPIPVRTKQSTRPQQRR